MGECPFHKFLAVSFFVLGPMLLMRLGANAKRNAKLLANNVATQVAKNKPLSVKDVVFKMEEIIQRDEGKRGIKEIFLPSGELLNSAKEMLNSKKIVIVTGFPCLLDYPVHTETDGPPGAVAIAKALLAMGKYVAIVTDECNEDVLLACVAGSDLIPKYAKTLTLESFPPVGSMTEKDYSRLAEFNADYDLFIAIERSGMNIEGSYRTMRNRDMTHLIAPLEDILMATNDQGEVTTKSIRSIGVGDGGNELGMGKAYQLILNSSIPNKQEIACIIPTNHLIVASVSNWGGYALGAAAAVLHATDGNEDSLIQPDSELSRKVTASIDAFLPTTEEEWCKVQRMCDCGARDGMTAKQDCSVDGMPLTESIRVLDELRNVLF